MSNPVGLICEFIKNKWIIIADSSPALYNISKVQTLLTCDNGYFHSTNVTNSYVSFYFSKPILINSYLVYSKNLQPSYNYLYNWELQYYNSNINNWIQMDYQNEYETIGNKEKIWLEKSIETNIVKLIGGKDRESDDNFLKFHKIEFYGHIVHQSNSQKINLFSFLSPYLFIIIH